MSESGNLRLARSSRLTSPSPGNRSIPQEPEKKPNYEEQVNKELDRVQQRVLLLNEMLNNAAPKERFVEGDAYDVRLFPSFPFCARRSRQASF